MLRKLLAVTLVVCAAAAGHGAEPFRFPAAKHGKGELKYINDIPVLMLAGSPEEIGEQMGVLGVKPATPALDVFKRVLKQHRLDLLMPLLRTFGENQIKKYPEPYRREFEALVKASGVERDLLVIGNTFNELRHLAGCSGLMIAPSRSKTGAALMGRNWDFPPVEGLPEFSAVLVFRPDGKRPFVVVSFPGFVASGCLSSSMNADGLAIGGNFIGESADKSPAVDWKQVPTAVVARRVLEECSTLDEAEKLIRAAKPAERHALVACDRKGGAVFEITSKGLSVRRDTDGICVGTNHFCCEGLAMPRYLPCQRMTALDEAKKMDKLGVADVARKMHEANQGAWSLHTMVFEPGPLKLHVAFGDGKKSATELPLKEIDVGKLMKR